jgi:ribose 5-phosphate isomerase B
MSLENKENRDKVRELVRQILETVPVEGDEDAKPSYPERLVVNSLKDKMSGEFDRDESAKSLITEDDLRGLEEGSRVRISANARFTPLASDLVAAKGLVLVKKSAREDELKVRRLAVGADHGGFELKEGLKGFLAGLGVAVTDMGTDSTEPVDYPDYAHKVARAVGDNQVNAGIIIDGAGIGSAMAANKVPGVRAAACYSAALARNAREHNGANILTLGAAQNTREQAEEIVRAFITTELTEERHQRRVGKINEIERKYRI